MSEDKKESKVSRRKFIGGAGVAVVAAAAAAGYYATQPRVPTVQTQTTSVKPTTTNYLQKLEEDAKKEGQVSFSSSATPGVVDVLKKLWPKKYPEIKADIMWVSNSILAARVLSEGKAGKPSLDATWLDSGSLMPLKAEGVLERYVSVNSKNLPPELVIDPDYYVQPAPYLQIDGFVYNTKLVKPEDVPKDAWQFYNNPDKWVGKLAMSDPSRHAQTASWLYAIRDFLKSDDDWKRILGNIKAMKPRWTTSNTPAVQAVIGGEQLIAGPVTVTQITAMAPAPLSAFSTDPSLALPASPSLLKNAQHPNAAKLLIEYLYTDEFAKGMQSIGEAPGLLQYLPSIPGIGVPKIKLIPVPSAQEITNRLAFFKQFFEIQ